MFPKNEYRTGGVLLHDNNREIGNSRVRLTPAVTFLQPVRGTTHDPDCELFRLQDGPCSVSCLMSTRRRIEKAQVI